ADDLHVVGAADNSAQVDVQRAAAGAEIRRHAAHQVTRAVAQDRHEARTEARADALADLAVGHGLAGLRVEDLFEEIVLGDVEPAALLVTLPAGDAGGLGHAHEVARAGAPARLDQRPRRGDVRAGLAGVQRELDARVALQVDAQLGRDLRQADRVAGRRHDDRGADVDELAQTRLAAEAAAGDGHGADLLYRV